uniref:Uncharacterized protein n=1 Tax=Arundo donax TaxID=35708 RepID=A0A0A9CFC6_ARUDO
MSRSKISISFVELRLAYCDIHIFFQKYSTFLVRPCHLTPKSNVNLMYKFACSDLSRKKKVESLVFFP